MSLMHECPECGAEYETGLNGSGGLCRQCERAEENMRNGGRGLTRRERAAMVSMHELVLNEDRLVRPDGVIGGLVLGDDEEAIDIAGGDEALIVA